MAQKSQTELATVQDPVTALRQMTTALDHLFESSTWPTSRWPLFRARPVAQATTWYPEIDVFEKDNRLITKIDLPGMKKEDVKVEVADGQLTISGERKSEVEENKDNIYRREREYGAFYRSVPLPEGVKPDDVKATFSNGVLEVSIPLPAKKEMKARQVEIEEKPSQAPAHA